MTDILFMLNNVEAFLIAGIVFGKGDDWMKWICYTIILMIFIINTILLFKNLINY